MRVPMIAGNWKMNTTVEEARALVTAIRDGAQRVENVETLVCPPFVSLQPVKEVLGGSGIKLGAQNLFYEDKGAYTGEVSAPMLAGICDYVILGHSERRQYFNETDQVVNKKIKAALSHGLKPILCIGEKLEENEAGKTEEVVTGQLFHSLELIDYSPDIVVAYEPIWAIGTGRAATSQQANDTIGIIRREFAGIYGDKAAAEVRILYGGSVNAANTADLIRQPEIDGGLVGGASLKAEDFLIIIKLASDHYASLS